jgi:hypothetical protein
MQNFEITADEFNVQRPCTYGVSSLQKEITTPTTTTTTTTTTTNNNNNNNNNHTLTDLLE